MQQIAFHFEHGAETSSAYLHRVLHDRLKNRRKRTWRCADNVQHSRQRCLLPTRLSEFLRLTFDQLSQIARWGLGSRSRLAVVQSFLGSCLWTAAIYGACLAPWRRFCLAARS